MIQTAIQKSFKYILCPSCMEEKQAGHLLVGQRTRWACDCGTYLNITRLNQVEFEITLDGRRLEHRLVTLESRVPVRLLVKGMRFTGEKGPPKTEADRIDHERHHYNEHTCPTNYLKCVEEVIKPITGEQDPHGIFEYVSSEPYTEQV